MEVLSRRVLNRVLLRRQLLLERVGLPVVTAVEWLVGLNAQDPDPPYLALWSRLRPFAVGDLTAAIERRAIVRSTTLRATQHLHSVADFRLIRPAVAPLLRRVQRNGFGRRTAGVDLGALVADVREILADGRVTTRPELGRLLAERHPGPGPGGTDRNALAWSVQYLEPLVHPAPSGTWRTRGPILVAHAGWTGVRAEATAADVGRLVRRYLAAFGPASVSDIRAWSGVSGLREVVDQLRPELRVYADESGRELLDLAEPPTPDPMEEAGLLDWAHATEPAGPAVPLASADVAGGAGSPDPGESTGPPDRAELADLADVPAPVRFLPPFDAPLLAYADRTRVMTDEVRRRVCDGAAMAATVLVDGTVAATWTTARHDGTVRLTVEPLRPLAPPDRDAVGEEGHRLLSFTDPEAAGREVHILPERG